MSNNVVQCVNGTFAFKKLIIRQKPGTNETIKVTISGLEDNGLPRSFDQDPVTFKVSSRACISGEELTYQGTCKKCGFGFYLMEAPVNETLCKQCDQNAICYGANQIAPRAGHYRSSNTSARILPCYNPKSCLGGDENFPQGNCSTGYRGFMCGSCVNNWVKRNWEVCNECPSYWTSLIWVLIRVITISFIVLALCHLQSSIAATDNKQSQNLVSLAKMVTNHCVLMGSIIHIKYNWSPTVDDLVSVYGEIVMYLSKYVSFNCFINGTTVLEPVDPGSFYRTLLWTCVSPILFIAWFTVLYFLQSLLGGGFKVDQWHCMIIVTLWLFHPDICRVVFASFACIDPDFTGESRLFSDLGTVCW